MENRKSGVEGEEWAQYKDNIIKKSMQIKSSFNYTKFPWFTDCHTRMYNSKNLVVQFTYQDNIPQLFISQLRDAPFRSKPIRNITI